MHTNQIGVLGDQRQGEIPVSTSSYLVQQAALVAGEFFSFVSSFLVSQAIVQYLYLEEQCALHLSAISNTPQTEKRVERTRRQTALKIEDAFFFNAVFMHDWWHKKALR